MKIYFNRNQIDKSISRQFYAEWIKPVFPNKRHSIYGLKPEDLMICESPADADLFILPLTWNYYFEKGELDIAINILKLYHGFSKPIFTWVHGDYTFNIPKGDFITFHHNLYSNNLKDNEYAYPVIIRDPVQYIKSHGVAILPKGDKPSISFCGLADLNLIDRLISYCKDFIFKIKGKIFKPYLDLEMPLSGTRLRGKILKLLLRNADIDTNFIIRRNVDKIKINKAKYKFDYWNNMISTPFVLCVRGSGNFSTRFFEALALGKIPILIDTNCVLPFEKYIQWDQHCLIIKESDFDQISMIIKSFFKTIEEKKFKEIQVQNRKLWIENLSYSGFFYKTIKHFKINSI
ncbi:MAG: hypothetical protein CMG55_08845 [Candidatus Marinimicrobia bacterium]|nr:hypothetical protein [Candidatus Neomarinimicrobiota bacterium]|tara:strand:+ start:3618 stop:4658 length:1041 start_codon:yes stop_codon:yes gene_type:complete